MEMGMIQAAGGNTASVDEDVISFGFDPVTTHIELALQPLTDYYSPCFIDLGPSAA